MTATTRPTRPDPKGLKDGARCKVIDGTHKGKSGLVRDINTSKGGNVTITPRSPRELLFNAVEAKFTDPEQAWQVVPMPRVESSAYVDDLI